jgi:hypothetical protein
MLDRLQWRVQPVEQIKKRKQRRRDMWERHEKFAEFVGRVMRKKAKE